MAAHTRRLVMIAVVSSPPHEKKRLLNGFAILVRKPAPLSSKKRYMKMLFIPTIMKNLEPFVKSFITSISQ